MSANILAGTATLSVNDSSTIALGTITKGASQTAKTISVTGADYLNKITVAVTGAFEVSDNNTTWGTSVDINSPTTSSKNLHKTKF